MTRVAVLRDPALPAGIGQLGAIQAVAPSLRIEVSAVSVRDPSEIEHAVAAFARAANGGLIVTQSALATIHRELIVTLAARHQTARGLQNRIPSPPAAWCPIGDIWPTRTDSAAGYLDRSSRCEASPNLPAQAPTKYELVINLRPPRRSTSKFRLRCSEPIR